MFRNRLLSIAVGISLFGVVCQAGDARPLPTASSADRPLFQTIDINIGESRQVALADGSMATIKLIDVRSEVEPVSDMVCLSEVTVDVNGRQVKLTSGNYRLPVTVGGVQIDCPVTGVLTRNTVVDYWKLTTDARLRIWPDESPWIRPGSFTYPVKQRWMAAQTWYSNEPVRRRADGKVYYHAGMDIGAMEGKAEVVAATDGVIVSIGDATVEPQHPAIRDRYDVIYIRDARGWLHRYSHLSKFDPSLALGDQVHQGQRLGLVGKEGASGGWTHLHYEIVSEQPSGDWGVQDSYAFLWQAYRRQYDPKVIAIARPHYRVRTGDQVTLDAGRSWAQHGIAETQWLLSSGQVVDQQQATTRYMRPGTYSEVLKVTDTDGNVDYDFATVRVADAITGRSGISIDANYWPSHGVRVGDEVTFSSRGRSGHPSDDTWNFGDDTKAVVTRSNLDSSQHASDGYAFTTHRFKQPGDYIVTVSTSNDSGDVASSRLHVHVESDQLMADGFDVQEGFQMQLVAREPLVCDPVAMTYDEFGRGYVIEMRDYPHVDKQADVPFSDQSAQAPLGRIRLLVDQDGDGQMDASTIFADQLSWPSGIAVWKGGVFVAATPDVWYFKDTDDDGKADVRRKVLTGFNKFNVQAVINNFKWGLDHRIYAAGSSNGADIEVTAGGKQKTIPLLRRDFSIDPVSESIEVLSGGERFGNTMDAWGNRFLCNIRNPCQHVVLPDRYLKRNRFLPVASVTHDAAEAGEQIRVYPISPPETWRTDRAGRRMSDLNFYHRQDSISRGYVTSSSGVTIYRGSAYPESFRGNAFTAEVAWNLFSRRTLSPDGVTFIAARPEVETDFARSTDNWFRPVNFVNAPDGTLHVLDMHRQVIEHPWSVPDDIREALDFRKGSDMGRIYRLAPPNFTPPSIPRLGEATTEELVATLQSDNGWHRETAHRLIFERQDRAAIAPLRRLVRESDRPLARAAAMWSLEGLESLDAEDLLIALRDPDGHVREHAVRLAESHWKEHPVLVDAVLSMGNDDDKRVRFQVAFSAGETDDAGRVDTLAAIARRDVDDPWIRTAVISSLSDRSGLMLTEMLSKPKFAESDGAANWLTDLARTAAAADPDGTVPGVLSVLQGTSRASRIAVVVGLGEGLKKHRKTINDFVAGDREGETLITNLMSQSKSDAVDTGKTVRERRQAIELLRHARWDDVSQTLFDLLAGSEPSEVQLAVVQTLAAHDDPSLAGELIDRWRELTPPVRTSVLSVLMSDTKSVERLMTALESGEVPLGQIPPAYRFRMLERSSDDVRQRAAKVMTGDPTGPRAEVILAYEPSLELVGDAKEGREVFRTACAGCHHFDGFGSNIGPPLASIQHRTAKDVMVNILDPNREVSPNHLEYVVLTTDGRVVTGVIENETATSLTLLRSGGERQTILRGDIDEIRSTDKSIMPEGLEKQINQQQMSDLLHYLLINSKASS